MAIHIEIVEPRLRLRLVKVGNLGIDYVVVEQPEYLRNTIPNKKKSWSEGNYVICSSVEPDIAILTTGSIQEQNKEALDQVPHAITICLRGHRVGRDHRVTKLNFVSKTVRDWAYAQMELMVYLFEQNEYFGEKVL